MAGGAMTWRFRPSKQQQKRAGWRADYLRRHGYRSARRKLCYRSARDIAWMFNGQLGDYAAEQRIIQLVIEADESFPNRPYQKRKQVVAVGD